MIVTLAHKLLIALWTTQQWGDAPEGIVRKLA
jgi:hypothetical protein